MILIARHTDGTVSKWDSTFEPEQYREAMKEIVETIIHETKDDPPLVVLARIK